MPRKKKEAIQPLSNPTPTGFVSYTDIKRIVDAIMTRVRGITTGAVTIINNLASTSTTAALAANQGMALHNRLWPIENIPNSFIPSISRVIIPSHTARQGDYTQMGIIVELDRPAPAGCFLQFHRYSKGSSTGSRGKRRHRHAFRPIDIYNTRVVWNLPIPQGAMSVTTASIRDLYLPPRLRGAFVGSATLTNIHKGISRMYANKCRYKFSINRFGQRGNLSAETVEIMQWVPVAVNSVVEARQNARLIARVY